MRILSANSSEPQMIEHQLIQGSQEWIAHRTKYRNASDTPAVTGSSIYKSRSDFLKECATGIAAEVNATAHRRFDEGHRFEALARPLMEKIVGEELFPVVGTDGVWGASFDGLTMIGDINAEHKTMNDSIRSCQSAADLHPMYLEQMEHQMMVSGAARTLFMATKWRLEDSGEWALEEEKHFWVEPDPELRKRIVAAWEQFEIDVANYQHTERKPAVISEVIDDLPALTVQLVGQVTASNLDTFKTVVTARIQAINTDLKTDSDFATADKMVKFLDDGEKRLDLVKSQALAQTYSIDELFRTIDSLKAEMRSKRLTLDKLVKAEKENRRAEIVTAANRALSDHLAALLQRVGVPIPVVGGFADVIKGLKSLDSMRDKVSSALANAKIEANAIADRIDANRLTVEDMTLFPDFSAVCQKAPEDFAALMTMRLAARKAAEEKRLEQERERIRREEQEKAGAEERAKLTAENQTQCFPPPPVAAIRETKAPPTAETMKLGEICYRLGYTVSADFLSSLGVHPVATEKNAKHYSDAEFPGICQKIADHTLRVALHKLHDITKAA